MPQASKTQKSTRPISDEHAPAAVKEASLGSAFAIAGGFFFLLILLIAIEWLRH